MEISTPHPKLSLNDSEKRPPIQYFVYSIEVHGDCGRSIRYWLVSDPRQLRGIRGCQGHLCEAKTWRRAT